MANQKITGNLVVNGSLTVGGDVTLNKTLKVTGETTLSNNLKVAGDTTLFNIYGSNLELQGSFGALGSIGGGFEISDEKNVGIELGRKDGTAGTPYIDFHTDGKSTTDYNSRLLAQGNDLYLTTPNGQVNVTKLNADNINTSLSNMNDQINKRATFSKSSGHITFTDPISGSTIEFECGHITPNNVSTRITFSQSFRAIPLVMVTVQQNAKGVLCAAQISQAQKAYADVNVAWTNASRVDFTTGDKLCDWMAICIT